MPTLPSRSSSITSYSTLKSYSTCITSQRRNGRTKNISLDSTMPRSPSSASSTLLGDERFLVREMHNTMRSVSAGLLALVVLAWMLPEVQAAEIRVSARKNHDYYAWIVFL